MHDFAATSFNMDLVTSSTGNCASKIDADTSSQLHADLTAPIPAGTNRIGYTTDDPCNNASTKVFTAVNVVTATNVIITAVAAKNKYICGIFLYPCGTDNIAVYQATTST